MNYSGTFTSIVRGYSIKRLVRFVGTAILVGLSSILVSNSAFAASGITYTGRIVKDDTPLDSGIVRFDVWIKTKDNCVLYYERRNIDMAGSGGTYSFEIGDANIIAGSQSFPQTGIQTISDIFNNGKSRANGDVDTSLQCSTFNPAFDEGRLMTVSFTPAGETAQALPDLAITAVPTAMQAFKIAGYGTGDLLKVDPTVTKTTYANGALNQAQYDEFWKLILGTSTTYLKAIPTLGGDVSGTLPAVTVTKIQNVAVTAPSTGDTGKVLTYNGTGMVWQAAAAGGITSINGLSGSTQSFAVGTSGTDVAISSSGSTHTINVPSASATNRGVLTSSDWSAFNAKQSSALTAGKVWIGNASNGAEAQTLSGDATVSASGNVTVDKTQAAVASKILQLDSSGNAYVNGVDIKGSGAVSAQLRYTGASNMVMNLPTSSGTANQFLQTDGAGNLAWASQSAMLPTISAGQVWVGNASGGAQAFTLSGDVASVSNTGLVTLTAAAGGANKLPLAGGSMSGAINMGGNDITNAGNIAMAANKYLGLSANSTDGTVAGQVWYDGGVIKYFDGTTVKSLGVAGAGITNLNGLSASTQSFVNGTAGNAPAFSSAGSAHTLNIPMASSAGTVTAGLISNAEYVALNSKQSSSLASTQVWVGNASGAAEARTLSGDITISNVGLVTADKTQIGTSSKLLQLDASGVANSLGVGLINSGTVRILPGTPSTASYDLKLPVVAPANNQILKSNASGDLSWVTYLAQVSDSAPLANGKMWIGNASGVAGEVAMSGDATISNAGLLTLKNTGTVGTYSKVVTDAQGRIVSGSALLSSDVTTALGYTPVNRAGDTMSGDLSTQNINIAAGKFLGLGVGSTDGTVAGQIWYDGGVVKYFDGTTAKSLGVAGAGITNLNGLSAGTQSFVSNTSGTDFAINSAGSAHTFSLPSASATNRGALTSADWSTFNAKQSNSLTSASVWVGNSSGGAEARALSGDVSVNNVGLVTMKNTGSVGTYYKVVTDAQGRVVSGSATLGATDMPSLNDGTIWIGNSGNTAVGYALSGDATMSNVGLLTLKNTGSVGTYSKVVTDAQGRIVSGSALAAADVTTALGYTPVNRAGDTMAGALNFGANDISNTGNIAMAANKYFGLSANSTNGAVAGQMWYDAGTIKYFDGTTTKSLGVAGAGITSFNGLSAGTQSFAIGTAGNSPAFVSATSTHTLNIPMASASGSVTAGLISNADYVNFNSKQGNALTEAAVWVGNSAGGAEARALSGDVVGVNNIGQVTIVKTTTGQANKILALDGSSVGTMSGLALTNTGTVTLSAQTASATYGLKLPAASPANNQILKSNASGDLSWVTYLAQVSDSAPLASGKMWIGNASGVASEVAMSGDATISNVGLLTLKNTGTAGTYFKVVTDAQGRVTSGSALASGDVTAALGYTPASATSGYVNGGNTFAGNATMGLNDAYNLGIKTNNATRMTITSDGKVGIGTVTPNTTLAVASGDITLDSGYSLLFGTSAYSFINGDSGGSSHLVFGTSGANVMYIDVNGNVGIGASPSSYTLDMGSRTNSIRLPIGTTAQRPANGAGQIRYNTSTNSVEFNDGSAWTAFGTGSGSLPSISAGQIWVGNASNGAQAFSLSGDVSTVSNTGLVTINKTTTGANNTILSLDGSGVATAKGLALVNTGTVSLSAATASSTYGLKLPAASPVANQIMQSDASGNLSWINTPSASLPSITAGKIWVGNASGGPEAFSLSGDIASVTNTGLVTLKSLGTVGTYWKVVTDAQGRVTSGSALASGDVTTALGYMPANGSLSFVNGGNTFAGNSTIGLNDAYTLGFRTNNATRMTLDASGNLGIGTTTMSNNLSFSGQSAQKIGVERTTTAATAGSDFTITAGGAYSTGTNLAGGTLTLSSGTSTGSGGSQILLQTATASTSGTTDRAPATKVTISGTTSSDAMQVAGTIRGTSYNNAASTTIDWSRGNTQYTTAGCTGTQYTFSNMRDGGVYTLAITGTFSANCTFGQTSPDTLSGTPGSGAFYFLPANSVASGSNAIFSFMRVGNNVYVQWNSGFQN